MTSPWQRDEAHAMYRNAIIQTTLIATALAVATITIIRRLR
jgi:hypothetical protein